MGEGGRREKSEERIVKREERRVKSRWVNGWMGGWVDGEEGRREKGIGKRNEN